MDVFLRGVWTMVPGDEDTSWVQKLAKAKKRWEIGFPDQGEIIRRMLQAGVSERDIARLCRIVGFETAQGILNLIDDPAVAYYGFNDDARELDWRIHVFDANTGEDLGHLDGVHDSFQEMDPTGREMEPPPTE
ncbi:MAG TPA: hypothetical protein VGI81_21040 [Tepidisphaeraceae bacterium]